MTKLGVGSLVVGLAVTVLALPLLVPMVGELNRAAAQLKQINDERERAAAIVPGAEQLERLGALPNVGGRESEEVVIKGATAEQVAAAAQAERIRKSLEALFIDNTKQKPTPVTGYAPRCAGSGSLRQAVNPTPGGSQYRGQLRVSGNGRLNGPCTSANLFGNTGKLRFGKLKPGTYEAPGGKVTVLGR